MRRGTRLQTVVGADFKCAKSASSTGNIMCSTVVKDISAQFVCKADLNRAFLLTQSSYTIVRECRKKRKSEALRIRCHRFVFCDVYCRMRRIALFDYRFACLCSGRIAPDINICRRIRVYTESVCCLKHRVSGNRVDGEFSREFVKETLCAMREWCVL